MSEQSTGRTLEVPLEKLKEFLKILGDHDLWDDLESNLREQGVTHVQMSREPLAAASTLVRSRHSSGALKADLRITPDCACHTPAAGGTPVKSPSGGGDGGVKAQHTHVRSIETKIRQLEEATIDLTAKKHTEHLLRIIHRPGWTTPQEAQLVEALLASLHDQIASLSRAHDSLVAAANQIGQA